VGLLQEVVAFIFELLSLIELAGGKNDCSPNLWVIFLVTFWVAQSSVPLLSCHLSCPRESISGSLIL